MANLLTNDAFPEFKEYSAFNPSAPTLEQLMLKGDVKDSWVETCEKAGQFLAITRKNFDTADASNVFQKESIRKQTDLGKWIGKMNNSWDAIKSMTPPSLVNNLNLEMITERGKKAAELIENANCVCLDNFVTSNVQSLPDQQNVQVNFNKIGLVYGPSGMEAAMFIADVLVKYYQQLTLEHNIRYITSDCAKFFGRAFESTYSLNEADNKKFWEQTSLLTGWEIIRRVNEDEALREWSERTKTDLVDVFEAGLRLIYNGRICSIGFMILIALAEI